VSLDHLLKSTVSLQAPVTDSERVVLGSFGGSLVKIGNARTSGHHECLMQVM
jgi:hypothetical protein